MFASKAARRACQTCTSLPRPSLTSRPLPIPNTLITKRFLASPSSRDQASVSTAPSPIPRPLDDPGPSASGDRQGIPIAERLENASEGKTLTESEKVDGEGGVEMFGFKLNPVATKTGGNAKVDGRPIYLDMQVSFHLSSPMVRTRMYHLRRSYLLIFLICASQATTPMDPRVLDAMMPFFTNQYGNPHSRTHAYGWEAEAAGDVARQVRSILCFHLGQPHATREGTGGGIHLCLAADNSVLR